MVTDKSSNMHASNRPTAPAADGAGPRTYADVVAGRGLRPHEVGKALYEAAKEQSWQDTWECSRKAKEDVDNSATHVKALLGVYGDALLPRYFLLVNDGKVRVLYGLRACRQMDADGRRYAGLIGERTGGGGCVIPPKLFVTREGGAGRQYQYQTFQRAAANAPTISAIQDMLSADGSVQFVPVATANADGQGPESVSVWRVFPVHAKVAALFMRELPVREAFLLAVDLYRSLPDEARDGSEPLLEFMRVAITEGGPGVSALETPWSRVDPGDDSDLEQWYIQLCQAYAPSWNPTPTHQPSGTAPAPAPSSAPGAPTGTPNLKRPYTQHELKRLHRVCGLEFLEEGDYTTANLPPFWKGFEAARGKLHTAREYVEGFLDNHWPPEAPNYQRFISTDLVQTLVALDFDGSDPNLMPSKRHKGISVYAIYPLADASDTGAARDKAMAYEDTMDNHRPREREEMGQISLFAQDTPGNRVTFWQWTGYFRVAVTLLFGNHFVCLAHLRRLEQLMTQVEIFRYVERDAYRGYYWKLHCAVRRAVRPQRAWEEPLQAFGDLLFRIRQGQPYSPAEIPPELSPRRPAPLAGKREETGGPGRSKPKDEKKKDISSGTQAVADRIAKVVGPALQSASAVMEKANAKLTTRSVFPDGLDSAFGEIMQMVKPTPKGSTSPCPRLFLYGRCPLGNCRASHELSRTPNEAAIKHYTDWVEARCAKLKENPKG